MLEISKAVSYLDWLRKLHLVLDATASRQRDNTLLANQHIVILICDARHVHTELV
jgi:hypothetical protein